MDKFVKHEIATSESAQEKLRTDRENRGAEQITPKTRQELLQEAEGVRRMIADTELRQKREQGARTQSSEKDEQAVSRLSDMFGELSTVVIKVHEESTAFMKLMGSHDLREVDELNKRLQAIEADLASGTSHEAENPHLTEEEVLETSKDLMPDVKQEISANTEKLVVYTSEDLAQRFPTPEGFFDNPSHCILFDHAKMFLSGERPDTTMEEARYAESFLDALTRSEVDDVLEIEKEKQLRENSDPILTQRLKEILMSHGAESRLHAQREILGIQQTDEEKPFDIIVVRSPEGQRLQSQKIKAWRDRTGAVAQFMYRDSDGRRIPTIFLPDYEADSILDPKNPVADTDMKMMEHEYRHTQRKFSFGHDRLFRLIDEVCTNVTGYGKETALLGALSLTTPELHGKDFKAAYELGDENKKAELLRKFAESFGSKGLLLLGGKKSSEHSEDHDGLKNLPFNPPTDTRNNENVCFAESLLRLRAEQSPDFLSIFEQRIKQPDVKRGTLEAWANMYLKPYFSKSVDFNVSLMGQLVERLQTEIKRRELAGEKGLYDGL
ncbi:hypothetical protein KBC54_04755 [Patescibacteria group bacterium]|nr:hypothetical protein [Patescibacteria group bacterium]